MNPPPLRYPDGKGPELTAAQYLEAVLTKHGVLHTVRSIEANVEHVRRHNPSESQSWLKGRKKRERISQEMDQ